jgi:predicted transcriptional regulator
MPLTSTSLKLDPEIKARVQKLAEAQRRSANWIMNEAIREFVSKAEARADFLRSGREAWEDYKSTGKHVSAERADAWLARLEAGELAPPPEPNPKDP